MNNQIFLYYVASIIIAALSGLGIGSGGLFIIMLTAFLGIDPLQARGMNLLFFVFSASAALLIHLKRKDIEPGLVIFTSVFAVIGTIVGSMIGSYLSPLLLRRIFGCILVLSGIKNLVGYLTFRKEKDKTYR